VPAELEANEEIRRALDICKEGAFTEAELYAYDRYWDSVRIEKTLIYGGRAEGLAKGREENLIDVVLNCRHNGFSIEQIQAITGLGKEKILEIFRSNALNTSNGEA
jgi:hypothetical protein